MLFGLCVNHAPGADRLAGIRHAEELKKMGYDYIEVPTNRMNYLSEEAFAEGKKILEASGLDCRACNDFMPMHFRVTGETLTPQEELEEYFKRAFYRIGRNGLGARVVVFGSPWCRSCPDGFDHETALGQIADFLRRIGEIAGQEGLMIGVENNNRTETNTLNHLPDIAEMTERVGLPNVGIHCDYYHLHFSGDDPAVLLQYPGRIVHTHIAKVKNRAYVTDLEGELPYMEKYAEALKSIGYDGGMSLEAIPDPARPWEEEARENLRVLRSVFA